MNKLVEVSERRFLVGRSYIQNAAFFYKFFQLLYIYRLLYNFLIIIFIIIINTIF